MIDVINLQRRVPVQTKLFQGFAAELTGIDEAKDRGFSVALVDDERMRDLNRLFRSKDQSTDVLSFPHQPEEFEPKDGFLGDIVISVDTAAVQSKENGLSLEAEIRQLMLHGLLHLCGYDHETDNGEMNAREIELREKLQI